MTKRRVRGAGTFAAEAYAAVREEILRGQLRPGTPVSRRRFARELGMSVVPVTDALKRLERRFGASPPLNLWVRTAPRGRQPA